MTREDLAKKKVLFCDLDGTLIQTWTGETFPQGVWDVQLKFNVWSKITDLFPNLQALYIVSNQGGIGHGYVNEERFQSKMRWICASLKDWFQLKAGFVPMMNAWFCTSNDLNHPCKKPNPGMLREAVESCVLREKVDIEGLEVQMPSLTKPKKEDMVMLGDASGREGDFSDSDKMCAQNFGIDYVDVRDFLKL